MDKRELFTDLAELYHTFYYPTANQGPITLAEVGAMVQTSGRGTDEWMYGVACAFRALADQDWPLLCRGYLPHRDDRLKLSKQEEGFFKGKTRVFWQKVKKGGKYTEFLHAQECKRRRDLG